MGNIYTIIPLDEQYGRSVWSAFEDGNEVDTLRNLFSSPEFPQKKKKKTCG